jgi:lysophospholipase L1-like esterase
VLLTKDEPENLATRRAAFLVAGAACCVAAFALFDARGRRRVVAAAFACVVAFALAEVLGRALLDDDSPIHRLNDAWLYEHVPGARKTYTRTLDDRVESVAFDVDADGFRGPELRPKGAGRRVVVYGDSFVAGMTTRIEDTFVARLGVALAAELGVEVEAVNAGVSGYGPDQALLRMEAEIPRLAPDLVVLAVCAQNDYGDLLRDRLFDLGPDGGLRRLRPTFDAELRNRFDEAQTRSVVVRRLDAFARRIHAAVYGSQETRAWGRTSVDLDECRREHRRALDGVAVVDNLFADHIDADVRLEPSSESARYKILLMGKVLEAARDAATKNGAAFVVVVIPTAWDVCPGYEGGSVGLARHPEYRADNLTRPIERIADAIGVAHVDLFAAFTETDANAYYWHGGDVHWNPAGQEFAAKRTSRLVAERGLLK